MARFANSGREFGSNRFRTEFQDHTDSPNQARHYVGGFFAGYHLDAFNGLTGRVAMDLREVDIKFIPTPGIAGLLTIPLPTEQQLRSHTAEFDKLVSMLREDSDVVRLDSKHVFLSKTSKRTVSEYRLNEYRRLFKKLGLEGGVHRYEPEIIRFIASTEGMFVPSSEKSFVHSTIELTPQVNSLDDVANQESTSQQPVYKKVFGNWYLYYESW